MIRIIFIFLKLASIIKIISPFSARKRLIAHYYIKKNSIVIDVGAFVGKLSSFYSKLVGRKGLVLAYEPVSSHFKILSNLSRKKKNIICKQAAISSEPNQTIKMQIIEKDLCEACTVEPELVNYPRLKAEACQKPHVDQGK